MCNLLLDEIFVSIVVYDAKIAEKIIEYFSLYVHK